MHLSVQFNILYNFTPIGFKRASVIVQLDPGYSGNEKVSDL